MLSFTVSDRLYDLYEIDWDSCPVVQISSRNSDALPPSIRVIQSEEGLTPSALRECFSIFMQGTAQVIKIESPEPSDALTALAQNEINKFQFSQVVGAAYHFTPLETMRDEITSLFHCLTAYDSLGDAEKSLVDEWVKTASMVTDSVRALYPTAPMETHFEADPLALYRGHVPAFHTHEGDLLGAYFNIAMTDREEEGSIFLDSRDIVPNANGIQLHTSEPVIYTCPAWQHAAFTAGGFEQGASVHSTPFGPGENRQRLVEINRVPMALRH